MADSDTPTADDIEAQVAADVEAGVSSFSDGTNQVTALDPMKRLDVASRIRGNDAAQVSGFGIRTVQLISPGGGF